MRFDMKIGEGLPQIVFDEDKIMQVLTNLINNSIKFTENGSITIETGYEDNCRQGFCHGYRRGD